MVQVIFSLAGGLALFIYGMQSMGTGLQKAAGSKVRRILEVLTSIPILGVLFGTLVTAIVQSSSLTTVLVVGFVNAGLMNLKQAISVIMGANIGTTVTAQILAFKLDAYALPIIAIGFILYFFFKNKKVKNIGFIIFSFGVLLFGLSIMSQALSPLSENESFRNAIIFFSKYRLLGVLVGLAATAIIQSSSAFTGILLALAAQGLIGLDAALPILLGSNIGTCITAVIASIGTKLTAKRTALAHVLFNVTGTVIFLILLPWFEDLVLAISPLDDLPRQIANAHTMFNLITTIILLPLINVFVKVVVKLLPGEEKIVQKSAIYLNWANAESPAVALNLASREVTRMGELASENVEKALESFVTQDQQLVEEVLEMEDLVDYLEKEITRYLVKVSQTELNEEQSLAHTGLLHACNDIERISDHAENIAQMTLHSMDEGLSYSETAASELREMHKLVDNSLKGALEAFANKDVELAKEVSSLDDRINAMEKELRRNHITRLNEGKCSTGSGVVFLDIISNFERIGDHANNICDVVMGKL